MPAEKAKIKWDKPGEHFYETGVRNGVLYLYNSTTEKWEGVPWNGLTSVSESPSGAEANPMWADDVKYLNLISREEFAATIGAYYYPDEFARCDGSGELDTATSNPIAGIRLGQQKRETFGLCYRTALGNDTQADDYGYKIHLIYNCTAAPSSREYATMNDSPEPIEMSWEVSTLPVDLADGRHTATITIDSTVTDPDALAAIEEALYGKDPSTAGGTDGAVPWLPTPDELMTIARAALT